MGYLSAAIKAVEDARVGDTITLAKGGATEALPGYAEAKPMVYAGRCVAWRVAPRARHGRMNE